MEENLIQFFTSPASDAGTNELLVFAQIATPFIALVTPFVMHWLQKRRQTNSKAERAEAIWIGIQEEALLLTNLLRESHGQLNESLEWLDSINPAHAIEPPALINSPSIWAPTLSPSRVRKASKVITSIAYFNKWIELVLRSKDFATIGNRTRYFAEALEELREALGDINPNRTTEPSDLGSQTDSE